MTGNRRALPTESHARPGLKDLLWEVLHHGKGRSWPLRGVFALISLDKERYEIADRSTIEPAVFLTHHSGDLVLLDAGVRAGQSLSQLGHDLLLGHQLHTD